MSKFIPVNQIKQLREASKNGDERAKKILAMQLDGKEDFSSLLGDYFNPQVTETTTETIDNVSNGEVDKGLEDFLKLNEITKDSPEYNDFVEDYYKEYPDKRPQENAAIEEQHECECKELIKKLMTEELDAINSYSKAITQVMASEEIDDNKKRKILSRFEEIKSDENEHYRELKELLSLCDKPEQEENLEGTID